VAPLIVAVETLLRLTGKIMTASAMVKAMSARNSVWFMVSLLSGICSPFFYGRVSNALNQAEAQRVELTSELAKREAQLAQSRVEAAPAQTEFLCGKRAISITLDEGLDERQQFGRASSVNRCEGPRWINASGLHYAGISAQSVVITLQWTLVAAVRSNIACHRRPASESSDLNMTASFQVFLLKVFESI
jgi:hypothetical protein